MVKLYAKEEYGGGEEGGEVTRYYWIRIAGVIKKLKSQFPVPKNNIFCYAVYRSKMLYDLSVM